MLYSLVAVLTTHPSFSKTAFALLLKSTFPHQGRLGTNDAMFPIFHQ